jgi:hypothetical protein
MDKIDSLTIMVSLIMILSQILINNFIYSLKSLYFKHVLLVNETIMQVQMY